MDIKKIAFIEAGSTGFQLLGKYAMSRVGSALLATMLAGRGYQVKVFIENIAPVDWDFVEGCDMVCISALTNTVMRAYTIADSWLEALLYIPGVHFQGLPVRMQFLLSGADVRQKIQVQIG